MKRGTFLGLTFALILASCNKGFETSESGSQYRIISHEEDARTIKAGDMLLVNLRMSTESSDSVIMETFKDNSPRYIPADEAVLKDILVLLAKGDSVEMLVNADTLFQKSFGVPKPESMKNEKNVHFIVKIVDVFDQAELKNKSMEQMKQLIEKDSLALKGFLSNLTNVQTTTSGLMYIVEKTGSGNAPKKGDKVSTRYKGTFLNGETFDENLEKEPFEFTIGLGQVIPGMDEGVSLMNPGSKYKLIIPWNLAYGERGSGPILPCSSLVFDVELLKVN